MTKSLGAVLGLLATTCVLSTPAIGRAPMDSSSVRVTLTDLDLSTQAGRRMLGSRINTAVVDVCTLVPSFGLLAHSREIHCRRAAWAGARPQIVTAVVRARKRGVGSSLAAAMLVSARIASNMPAATGTLTPDEEADIFRFSYSH